MKTFAPSDSGNALKKELVLNLTKAFASYDLEKVGKHLAEDVVWTLVGDTPIGGKDQFLSTLSEMSDNKAEELRIHQILSHGKFVAVHGEMKMLDGKSYGFADFYEFTSAGSRKVKAIVSYVIPK